MTERVVVVGAGTMGHGIAQVAAMANYDVMLVDTNDSVLEAGRARIVANLDEGVRRGKVTAMQRDAALARLRTATSITDAAGNAVLAIEAVPERMDLKQAVFAELGRHMPGQAILATNTSSLSVTTLQRATSNAARVIGMHFFNPVHINKLLE
ncbi:MAG: 3-hydroxyacyl-CoA dehydrogenase family protein, partial [Longimicrobiales bacterium]